MNAKQKHRVERIYSALPVPLQNAAFTAWGHWTKRQRYGRAFDRALEGLLESEWWSAAEIEAFQTVRLREVVADAARNVPYYRDLFRQLKLTPADVSGPRDLPKLPVLTKETVRRDPARFVNERFPKRALVSGLTSGTTGSPLPMVYTHEAVQVQWAVWWRHRARFGLRLGDPFLMFGARLPVIGAKLGAPFWRRNGAINQTYVSTYHITPETVRPLVGWLDTQRFDFFTGYPSAMAEFARMMSEAGLRLHSRPKYVVTGSDALLPGFEHAIESAFGVPVTEQYGMAEAAGNYAKCERGLFHLDHEFGIAELLDGEGKGPAAMKRLVFTGLQNPAMPLIRYEVGDLGEECGPCNCGRSSPALRSISGRVEDYVVTPDGRVVIGMNQVFEWAPNLWEAQVRQERADAIRVLCVPKPGFGDDDEAILRKELRYRVGERMDISIERVSAIEREANGKFRGVVSTVARPRAATPTAARRTPVHSPSSRGGPTPSETHTNEQT